MMFQCVAFPIIGNPRLSAPEVFLGGPPKNDSASRLNDGDVSPTEQIVSWTNILKALI